MGVNFYHSKSENGHGKPWFYVDPKSGNKIDGFAYSRMAFARGRMASHFNLELGIVISILPDLWSPRMKEIGKDIDPYVPPHVAKFLCTPDCEGCLSPELCKEIVLEFGKSYDPYYPIEGCKMDRGMHIPNVPDYFDNQILMMDDTAWNANYLWNGIKKAAEKKLFFRWS